MAWLRRANLEAFLGATIREKREQICQRPFSRHFQMSATRDNLCPDWHQSASCENKFVLTFVQGRRLEDPRYYQSKATYFYLE